MDKHQKRIQWNSFLSITLHPSSVLASQAYWCSTVHGLISLRPLVIVPLHEASPQPVCPQTLSKELWHILLRNLDNSTTN